MLVQDQFEIVSGYDSEIVVTLSKVVDSVESTFAIATDGSATVKAALVSGDRSKLLAGPWSVVHTAAGSDWAVSKVVVEVPAGDVAGLSPGNVVIELQVDDGSKKLPWFVAGDIVRGHIA